jgi:hypothetical protein
MEKAARNNACGFRENYRIVAKIAGICTRLAQGERMRRAIGSGNEILHEVQQLVFVVVFAA